jgi:hypothetical protein
MTTSCWISLTLNRRHLAAATLFGVRAAHAGLGHNGSMKQVAIPEEVFDRVTRWAAEKHVPVEDFVATAIVDQMAAHRWVAARGARSQEKDFLWALDQAPDVAPPTEDR